MSVPRKVSVDCVSTNKGQRLLITIQPVDRPKTTISLTFEEAYHVLDAFNCVLPVRNYPKETK